MWQFSVKCVSDGFNSWKGLPLFWWGFFCKRSEYSKHWKNRKLWWRKSFCFREMNDSNFVSRFIFENAIAQSKPVRTCRLLFLRHTLQKKKSKVFSNVCVFEPEVCQWGLPKIYVCLLLWFFFGQVRHKGQNGLKHQKTKAVKMAKRAKKAKFVKIPRTT